LDVLTPSAAQLEHGLELRRDLRNVFYWTTNQQTKHETGERTGDG